MLKGIGIGALVGLLVGCGNFATTQKSTPDQEQQVALAQLDGLATPEQEERIIAQLEACNTFFGIEGAEAKRKAEKAFFWTAVGVLSGSVITPALTTANAAANAPWISMFGSISGASSALVNHADNVGIGARSTLQGIIAVAEYVREPLAVALDVSKTSRERFAAAAKVHMACSMPFVVPGYPQPLPAAKPAPADGAGGS
ncbi:MAG: hypothetical protein ABGX82_08515 [Pseudomonas sp.]|uniref:hypothetical protein n=1 Tax=Pseudomonas sp. TaxID=306 RepID=UPI0032427D6C